MGTDIVIYISFACIEGTNINAACGYTASKWRTESSIDVRYGGTKMHSAVIKSASSYRRLSKAFWLQLLNFGDMLVFCYISLQIKNVSVIDCRYFGDINSGS